MFELMGRHESKDNWDRRHPLVLKPLEDSGGVQLRSVVNQIVQFSAADLGNLIRCALWDPRCEERNGDVLAGTETNLERSVVGHIASNDVDVLEARDDFMQVGGSCWISDNCEDDSVGSAGLENRENLVAIKYRNRLDTRQLTNILEADAPRCAHYNVRGHDGEWDVREVVRDGLF